MTTIKLPKKENVCRRKVTFTTYERAKKVGDVHGHTPYKCPICFCFHLTSQKDWKMDYVDRQSVEFVMEAMADVIEKRKKKERSARENIENRIKNLEGRIQHLLKELEKSKRGGE